MPPSSSPGGSVLAFGPGIRRLRRRRRDHGCDLDFLTASYDLERQWRSRLAGGDQAKRLRRGRDALLVDRLDEVILLEPGLAPGAGRHQERDHDARVRLTEVDPEIAVPVQP